MKIKDIVELVSGTYITECRQEEHDVTSGFVGDLLSVVMGKAEDNCAWVTIQSHINIVAVASLVGAPCIIVSEGYKVDEDARLKADEEDITIVSSKLSSYQIVSLLSKNGLL